MTETTPVREASADEAAAIRDLTYDLCTELDLEPRNVISLHVAHDRVIAEVVEGPAYGQAGSVLRDPAAPEEGTRARRTETIKLPPAHA